MYDIHDVILGVTIVVFVLANIVLAIYFFGYRFPKDKKRHSSFTGKPLESGEPFEINTEYLRLIDYFENNK